MKSNKILKIAAVASVALFSLNCANDDSTATTSVCAGADLNGDITADTSVGSSGGEVVLCGPTTVKNGYTLTIAAGTTVKATASADTVLIVEAGASINATGTSGSPIVFTSGASTPANGDWGGLVINGNSTYASGTGQGSGEGNSGTYGGGTSPTFTDDSGTLKYVRVEYGGEQFSTENELNGIAFQGVGNGTTVEYVQVYGGKDDGIEFFGGSVNASNIIINGAEDDLLDWTSGWVGTIKNIVLVQTAGDSDSNAIEADHDSSNPTNQGTNANWSAYSTASLPVIVNATVIGNQTKYKHIFRLRRGTGLKMQNSYIENFCGVVKVDGDESIVQANTNDTLYIKNSIFNKIDKANTTCGDDFTETIAEVTAAADSDDATQTLNSDVYQGSVATDNTLVFAPATATSYKPASAITGATPHQVAETAGAYTGPTANSVTPDNYIGAVDPNGTDWTTGWTKLP